MELEQKNKNDVANKKKKKIVVMWKIVGTPKVSVLYIYIDNNNNNYYYYYYYFGFIIIKFKSDI